MRLFKKQYSKRRKKRQFEETNFLTYWSDLFNFANLGPGAYYDDTSYMSGGGIDLLGLGVAAGTAGGVMMAGMMNPQFQVRFSKKSSDFDNYHFQHILRPTLQFLTVD